MWSCIRSEMVRINKREEELRNLVHGVKVQQQEQPVLEKKVAVPEKPMTQYI